MSSVTARSSGDWGLTQEIREVDGPRSAARLVVGTSAICSAEAVDKQHEEQRPHHHAARRRALTVRGGGARAPNWAVQVEGDHLTSDALARCRERAMEENEPDQNFPLAHCRIGADRRGRGLGRPGVTEEAAAIAAEEHHAIRTSRNRKRATSRHRPASSRTQSSYRFSTPCWESDSS